LNFKSHPDVAAMPPGFVAKLEIWSLGTGAATAWWLLVLWLMQSCWHLRKLLWQTTQYLD